MTDPFARMVDDLYAHLGEPATYTPANGSAPGAPLAVTVIAKRPDKEIDVGVSGLQVATQQADIRVSELPSGADRGDVLDLGGESFVVRRITRDAPRLIATLDLDPV